MRSGKYTLDDQALVALSNLQPLRFVDGHNFQSMNYDDALEENSGININRLTPPYRERFKAETPDYILVFIDQNPMAWFSHKTGNWTVPKLTMGLPHASLYRLTIFIDGLRLGRLSTVEIPL